MKSVALNAYPRSALRRGAVKKLRASGRVPAVIYGRYGPPQHLEVKHQELEDLLHHSASGNALVDLAVEGDARPKRLALLQEVQQHPLSGDLLHIDLHEVKEDERVAVTVPVESVGEAVGVKTGGGVLEHVLFKLKVRALAKDIPEAIYVDVSNLNIGQTVHLGEITPPAGVEILGDKAVPVLSVAAPLTEEQAAALEATTTASATEPEMIKEKKEGEVEGEAAGAAPKGAPKAAEKAPTENAPTEKTAEKPPKAAAKPEKKK